ncbi:hypothetical protein P170DRAFT_427661 [Aspergillus steynii IBT 23096]|uniref:Uncharacterized protein n=1 Tax=Aspergillus steynii IBT 23096 TaxID=1392250 RepID=A0A2I2G0D6_9EURO|nr:uncharacterized protein P170DRAFT_427661 [Aspergillus steynii IBT 23096]PLB46333.1 hypothetical protein P170DRAFT_427661 [Aspergillus steynii IBT 23096]
MSGNIGHIIKAIPGLSDKIVDFLDRRLSRRPSKPIDRHSFQILIRQLSKTYLENTDPSMFLVGIGIRLAISRHLIASTRNFEDIYRVMEVLHHTIRGAEVSEFLVTGVLVKLAQYTVEQENYASKESMEFTKIHLAELCIAESAPVCTATEYICNYGERRLSRTSHEVACGLVLPRRVHATFFLHDLFFLLKEIRRAYLVFLEGEQSGLQTILLGFIQSFIEVFRTLIKEWSCPKLDPIQFGQEFELYSLLGVVTMLLDHLRNGNTDLLRCMDFAIQGGDNALCEIRKELRNSMRRGNLSREKLPYAAVAFGPSLDLLQEQLLRLQKKAGLS